MSCCGAVDWLVAPCLKAGHLPPRIWAALPPVCLLWFLMLSVGCSEKKVAAPDPVFRKLNQSDVMYYLMLEQRLGLGDKSLTELRHLVSMQDEMFQFESERIAGELSASPFTGAGFLSVAEAVSIARFARLMVVSLQDRKEALADTMLARFSQAGDRTIRDRLSAVKADQVAKKRQFSAAVFWNLHLLDECRIKLKHQPRGGTKP